MIRRDPAPAASAAFVAFAAMAATYLSGIAFPEQNNIWTIPVVLDFAGSAEGPHDAYHASFARFVSLFWLAVRAMTTEGHIATVYLALQLAGNALLAFTLFALIRQAAGSALVSACTAAFLAFCYGLWGTTRLGYSELFSTYATHTQYAIILSLAGLGLVAARRGGAAGLVIGLAGCCNLFIGAWAALAAGLALVADERRVLTGPQLRLAVAFLVLAVPMAAWALAGGEGGAPPVSFFRDELAGHVYAARYPQAAVQTFALGIAATLAALASSAQGLRRLGLLTGAAVATLGLAAAMPYLAEVPLLLLLHPLRFVSVAVLLAAACAGALLVAGWRGDARLAVPASIALAGFMLKLPVVSLFGFALAIPADRPRLRWAGAIVALAGMVATLLPSPIGEVPGKAVLGFLVMAAAVAIVAWRHADRGDWPRLIAAGSLGAATVVAPSELTRVALLLAAAAMVAAWLPRGARPAVVLAILSAALSLTMSGDATRSAAMALGFALLAAPLLVRRFGYPAWWPGAAAAGLVALLMLGGLARGAATGFVARPDAVQRDWHEAQRWARARTPSGAVFLPIGVGQGFALFARRPVWWEQSQMAAVLWQPSFLPGWARRRDALASAPTPAERVALARADGIAYLVVAADTAPAYVRAGAQRPFANTSFAILRLPGRSQTAHGLQRHDRQKMVDALGLEPRTR